MKAFLFMPFAFAAGAEGFALFVPYLLALLTAIYISRSHRRYRHFFRAFRLPSRPVLAGIPNAQPAV